MIIFCLVAFTLEDRLERRDLLVLKHNSHAGPVKVKIAAFCFENGVMITEIILARAFDTSKLCWKKMGFFPAALALIFYLCKFHSITYAQQSTFQLSLLFTLHFEELIKIEKNNFAWKVRSRKKVFTNGIIKLV